MLSMTIPKIFFNVWFWFAIMAVIIIIHYFWGKAPPPPKPSKFFTKYKKTITKILNIYLIIIVLLVWLMILYHPISSILAPPSGPEIQAESFHLDLALLLLPAIPISGLTCMLVGLLSVFQTNLTRTKRVILLGICLLPIVLSILLLMIEPSLGLWSTIKLGLNYSLGCWIINGPAIIIGKHLFQVAWTILCKLRLASGDYPR